MTESGKITSEFRGFLMIIFLFVALPLNKTFKVGTCV